ncbi:hypothetical protein WQ54_19355 [Bacillus sp. SA1-12]|uniref:hypothetical protein n=1 Tax=Bacillus sp. SA1-12 TaxID=1455638 RepID=UPI000627342B|nr:hypothetical protein [Bacillus sp. SA1-12]KKI90679.1 hypothetical protein WQ54_19355 [Bacillus sp. SA1-12]
MVKEKQVFKQRAMVPLRDFIYLCIILMIGVVAVLALIFGSSTRAGENLNFAATLISIILAVLAIVITLIDATGQKEGIRQFQDAIDNLESSLGNLKGILENTREQYNESLLLNKDLVDRLSKVDKWKEDIINEIRSSAEISKGPNEESKIDISEIEKILRNKELNIFKPESFVINNTENSRKRLVPVKKRLEKLILDNYNLNQWVKIEELQRKSDLLKSVIVTNLLSLEEDGIIELDQTKDSFKLIVPF